MWFKNWIEIDNGVNQEPIIPDEEVPDVDADYADEEEEEPKK